MDALRILATNRSSQASTRTLSLSRVGIMTAFSLLSMVLSKFSILFTRLPLFTGTLVSRSTTELLPFGSWEAARAAVAVVRLYGIFA